MAVTARRVEDAPPILKEAPVGHLVGQGVLEGVLDVGEQARLVEELGGLEPGEALGQRVGGSSGDACEHGHWDVGADHRGGLEQRLVLWRQPVDARRQDRLHRRRHVDGVRGLHEPVRAALAHEHPVVDEAPHALLEEERIALGPREEEPLQGLEAGVAPEQRLQQRGRTLRRERVQPELAVVGLPAPAVPVLGTVVDEEQEPGRRQALDQPVEHRLRLGVDPVEVLEHDQERLDLALPQEEPAQGVDGPLPPRGRVQRLPPAVLHRHVEEREERRQRRLERAVEREELARDLLPDGARLVPVTDLEVTREETRHREIRRGLAIRDGARLEDQPAVGPVGVGDLPDHPRLSDARLADERDHLAMRLCRASRAPRGPARARRPARRSA